MLYDLLKRCVCLFFNTLNRLLGGKLPPFGSAAVLVEKDNRYLVVELPGKRVVFPGGFMNWQERPQECAEREGFEETGLLLHVGDLINYYTYASQGWKEMSNISFVFHAEVIGGELTENIEGHPTWMTEQELRIRMQPHSLHILDDYLRYRERQRLSQEAAQLFPKAS